MHPVTLGHSEVLGPNADVHSVFLSVCFVHKWTCFHFVATAAVRASAFPPAVVNILLRLLFKAATNQATLHAVSLTASLMLPFFVQELVLLDWS